ncbi:chloride channel protein [Lichenihabitans sp. PAMC28606]|uniref:chloride channel protein n=1 Tax=Lichenihabitans sp. PAMC28606 TaxID=2880932 RepID=UPI001D0B453F|nr:chloride channel protein [Lichenihabitans sp. PAMC28606]UDL94304.1 chloride channel protein [Lichenihabitans sp. PAMC28606]
MTDPVAYHRRAGRHVRHVWWPMWRRRALFVVGGLAVGGLAVAMAKMADAAQGLFHGMVTMWPWAPFVLGPGGFALAAWLTSAFFPGAQGSGIPQVIAAHHMQDMQLRSKLVSLRIAGGKIVLLLLGLVCGASAGREGPTVQVGASTMFFFGRLEPHRQPGLLLAGSAAGIAAAFNAPLAGIIFGIEEMSRSFEVRASGLVLGTVIAAGLTSLAVVGDYTYFGSTSASLPIGPQWIAVLVAGVICGLAGGLFSRILIVVATGFVHPAGRWIKTKPILFAALCGLGLALCGLAGAGSIFGTGYEQAQTILRGNATLTPLFGPLKLFATALSSVSGIPGGIFSPSLAVGAGLAQDLAPLLPQVPLSVLAVLCMTAYLTGVVQAPLTSFVIVSEMTENHALVIPIMLASLVAQAASKLVCKEGVYHALSTQFMPIQAPKALATDH